MHRFRQLVVKWLGRPSTCNPIALATLAGLLVSTQTFPAFAQPLFASGVPTLRTAQRDDFGSGVKSAVTLKQPLLEQKPSQVQATVRTVSVKGIGATSEEAQRDAARQAVQEVAGLYIDARRKVESKITDQAISDIVHEKILSYSNAYITKLEVTNVTKQPDGLVVAEAKISVAVAPLIKALQNNNVPTVAFDTPTARGQVEIATREKQGAIDLYADLLKRASNLIAIGIGTPRVNTTLAAPVDQSWLTIPITYMANDEAVKEWRSKFERIAAKHMTVRLPVRQVAISGSDTRPCSAPVFDPMAGLNNVALTRRFLGERIPFDQHGVTACFVQDSGSPTITVDCFGRTFLNDARPSKDICEGEGCLSFAGNAKDVGMRFEFLDASGKIIESIPVHFTSFPMLHVEAGSTTPPRGASGFFNYCASNQSPFYFFGQFYSAYGELIVLPRPGDRFHAYGNFLLPNDVIARTASVRARIVEN